MAKRPRIAVIGSANIDLTTFTSRFPKPGETIFGDSFDLGFGGKGANQAVAARLCGADVFMVARVGSDLFGPATIENFKRQGIDATHVKQLPGVSSGVAPIFVEPSGQNRIFVVKGANDRLMPADVDAAADLLKTIDSTGAGDAFIGSFAVFLGEGVPEREAVRRANLYAGLSTTGVGTQKSFYERARYDAEWTSRTSV